MGKFTDFDAEIQATLKALFVSGVEFWRETFTLHGMVVRMESSIMRMMEDQRED